jgi:chromosomal replication initiator protein
MTPNQILQVVCKHFGVSREDLKRRCRKQQYIKPRFTACYLLYRYTDLNYRQIMELLYPYLNPENNHDVPIYAVKVIEHCLVTQTWIYEQVLELEEIIQPMKKAI